MSGGRRCVYVHDKEIYSKVVGKRRAQRYEKKKEKGKKKKEKGYKGEKDGKMKTVWRLPEDDLNFESRIEGRKAS